ncbi:hypothetical protein [Leptospira neocaledonica]|uniref:hypothetical protein n=1 Tax=Leptospira neocaledonica TaxID=2023192 RepID=UPI000F651232|nr:hypothetical protein [Leptospira neocaledonica]
MKPFPFPSIIIFTIILLGTNCFAVPTNERTACRYRLNNTASLVSNDSCNFATGELLIYSDPSSTSEQKGKAGFNSMLFLSECVEYHKRLEECNKEINKYIPTLHPQ